MPEYQTLTDIELTGLLKSGDHTAFQEIYDRQWGLLYLHAYKMLRDDDEAKDMVQDVFISLWDKSATLELKSGLTAYLFSALRNKVLNYIRNKEVRLGYHELFLLYFEEHKNDTLEKLHEKDLKAAIDEVVRSLPDRMREIFELSRTEHLSHREIAEKLNISEKTVKKQISNSLSILRNNLNKPECLLLAIFLHSIK